MWRSWVDRINTINKTPDESQLSKEDQIKQEQQRNQLLELWQRCNDLLSSDEERSETLLTQVIPLLQNAYQQFDAAFAINILPDVRAFIGLISKELISGIRRIPEHEDKSQSSDALMNNLRSSHHLFPVIKAIQILSFGPENVLLFMLQQRIPSIVIKLFRSFIDLSSTYYVQDLDVDMATIDDVGKMLSDSLKQFLKNQAVLHRMITDDSVAMIVRIMTAKPLNEAQDLYIKWKVQVLDILKSIDMNSEVCQYLRQRRCIEILVRVWREALSKDYLTPLDHREIMLALNLLHYQFLGSAKINYFSLMNEMLQASGYELLCKILKTGPYKDATLQLKMEIINRLVELSFIGKISPIPSISDGLPYQHSDFLTPQPTGNTDRIVKNIPCFQCLLTTFLHPLSKQQAPTPHEIPATLHIRLFNAMKEIIMAHPCNYFVLEHTNSIPQFIESMDKYDIQIQKGIMDLLLYIMVDLNFVPLKEIAVLSLHLQSSSSGKLIPLICQYLTSLLNRSSKYLIVVQESGLLNIIGMLLSDVTDKLQDNLDSDDFLNQALDNFDTIIDSIIAMTSNPANVTVFRKSYRGNLFDLLQYPQTRIGALRLFESLSSHSNDFNATNEVTNTFSKVMEAVQYIPRDDLDFRLEVLKTIKRIFVSHKLTRDIFRRVGGYVSLVSMIVALEGAFEEPERFLTGHNNDLQLVNLKIVEVLQTVFSVLAESMNNHETNKKYFLKNVGYESLENAVSLTGAFNKEKIPEHIFGILFGFAIDDLSVNELFVQPEVEEGSSPVTLDPLKRIELTLKSSRVENPEIAPTILHLQEKLLDVNLSRAVLCAIYTLAQGSRGNQSKLNASGLIMVLLKRVFPEHLTTEDRERDILLEIAKKLMNMGVSYDELRYMFQRLDVSNNQTNLETSPGLLELILQGASRSRWPNFIQFDMGRAASPSLQVLNVSDFPPMNPGYTLLSWIYIEKQDHLSNLFLFSVWDERNAVFRMYIDASTKMLRVYNPVSKQDTVFKSFEFRAGFWYHLVIVHHKSRLAMKSSSMSLYVNGVFIETVSCPYVNQSPSSPLRIVFGALEHEQFNTGSTLIWDLGPTYLILDTMEKETINLLFNLGARYKSLFQDQLRQFQTYEASTALFLFIRSLSGRNDSSSLANVMKNTHFQSIPEQKILFAFFSCNTLSEGTRTGMIYSGISEPTKAAILAEFDSSQLLLNSAIPKLDAAVYMPKRMGHLIGGPIIAYPFGIDESIWKIGGCAVALKLIEKSQTTVDLCKSTAILFEIIRYSWRNSEEMEKGHGYEILAHLLKQKRELITTELVDLLLVFIGKNHSDPEESIINNPLAYRYVILNFEIWKKTSIAVQKAHLDQFILFLNTSKLRYFNSKRLPKIHIVKKVLLAFRMNIYAKELVPHLIDALKVIMLTSWTTESIRSVATFLASTVSKASALPAYSKAPRILSRSDSTRSTSSASSVDADNVNSGDDIIVDARLHSGNNKVVQMRNIVLEMLHDILCDEANGPDYINKFSVTITNKWPLLFFSPGIDPFSVVLAARIFARLCVSQGPLYVQKFRSTEGFVILKSLLPAYWNLTQLQETLVILMLGIDIAKYPLYNQFDINHLRVCLQRSKEGNKIAIPDVLPIIMCIWDEGRKIIELPNSKLSNTPTLRPARLRSNSVHIRSSKDKTEVSASVRAHISRTMDGFIQLFNEMYNSRPLIKEAYDKQEIVDCMMQVLFPAICTSHQMTAEDELVSKDVVMTNFDLDHQNSPLSALSSPIDGFPFSDRLYKNAEDDAASIESTATAGSSIIKRGGTSSLMTKTSPHVSKRVNTFSTRLRSASWSQSHMSQTNNKAMHDQMVGSLLKFAVDICSLSIVDPQSKSLIGLTIVFSSFPPSSHEQQLLFESYLLTHISQNLKSVIQLETNLLADPRIMSNFARFSQIAADAVIQGRFKEGGAEQTYDLLATLLEFLHIEKYYKLYTGNDPAVSAIYRSFNRMILLKISDLEHTDSDPTKTVEFLDYCIHHQKIISSSKNTDMEFLKCFCYHLYLFLLANDSRVKDSAVNMWKLLILQKPDSVNSIINIKLKGIESEDLIDGFKQMLEMDHESFYTWLDSRKVELNILFIEHISKAWEATVLQENKYSKEALKNYVARRINKLKKIQKREMYDHEIIAEYNNKTLAWSQSIYEIEMNRFTKALQDFDGHENFISSEWSLLSADLTRERSLWGPEIATNVKWRLDDTEGPNRMRKRLQAICNNDISYMPKQANLSAHTHSPAPLKPMTNKIPVNKMSDTEIDKELTQEGSSLDTEDSSVEDDTSLHSNKDARDDDDQRFSYEEDKNRKVLRLLDQGDMVLDVYNVSQISGLDACEGLLLLCKNNIYLIDNFFQLSDGEVVEIWDVPKEERDQYLLLVAQAAGMETDSTHSTGDLHTCRKWATSDLRDVFKRRFLFRDVALEIFFNDGQNALITVDMSDRDDLYAKLVSRVPVHEESGGTIFGGENDRLSSTFKLSSIFGTSTLQELTQRWERREVTNFQYLMYLNAIAGRSYNDLTQYPVFPWILADYTSDELDLTNPKTFRDLTRPMGAQTLERRQEFAERYRQWGETNDPTPAFHYGTHYSSAMIVCSFLIRLEPFTQHYLKLQGGTFDHADRLFDSVGKAWESASEKNMGDVRELIPEFFYLPEFLTNVNKFNFGVKQGTGEVIDSVVLPPWAHNDPKIFIDRHREALESDFVSNNLHHWIDLIFGYKQQGQAAIDSLNVFHHVSYEGAVDLDAITDIVEKTATIGIINNFGQTPRQLFKKPHPARNPSSNNTLSTGYYVFQNHLEKLIQSLLPVRDIKQQIESINLFNDKLGVTHCQQILVPSDGSRYIEWGFTDKSMRLYSTDTGKLLKVFENMHVDYICKVYFIDSHTLITCGTDNLVCIWDVKEDKTMELSLLGCLRGHTSAITSIAASKTYSVLVTGSKDKTAIIWDLNRKQYVRSLTGHENDVHLVQINDTTGDIITCSGHIIRVWTVNGDLYLSKSACASSEAILSCIFYQHKMTEWYNKDLIITGHKKGIVKLWFKILERDPSTGEVRWNLVLAHQLRLRNSIDGTLDHSDIISLFISNTRKTLFTGSKEGRVYSFVMPDTPDTFHLQREDKCKECMSCGKVFSVLERKIHCRTCGGIFCSGCISNLPLTTPDKSARFCQPCHERLAPVCNKY